MLNCIWSQCGQSNYTPDKIKQYKDAKISVFALQVGWQHADGNIEVLPYNGEIEAFIATVRPLGFKVWAWISCHYTEPIIIETAEQRTNAVNNCITIMQKYGFDGFVSDIEGYYPWNKDDDYYFEFVQELSDAIHAIGKIHINNMVVGDAKLLGARFQLLKSDIIVCMNYDGTEYTDAMFKEWADYYLTNSPKPVLMGIQAWGTTAKPLQHYLTLMDEIVAAKTYKTLAGFKVFWNPQMTDQDWLDWKAWSLKNMPSQTQLPIQSSLKGVLVVSALILAVIGVAVWSKGGK